MTFDLRREPWIPFRRQGSGRTEWAPLVALTQGLDTDPPTNPVVALATPRPDFDGALQELLVGLLTVALQPADEAEWRRWWDTPPTPTELQTRLDALPPAFDLDGDGPRFLQDLSESEFAESDAIPIGQILIEAPGGQTEKQNKDLFAKRWAGTEPQRFSRAAAAMALATLQTYAPAGGRGIRTSLRGGGPLTTLIDPRLTSDGDDREVEEPLWRKLWANVPTRQPRIDPTRPATVFPWLAATRVSDPPISVATTPDDVHPLQAFFGLPRRIRLEFDGPGRCDLTGIEDERTVVAFRTRPYGVQYTAWQHPLSPYYLSKPNNEWLPVHGQPSGLPWKDWIGLTLEKPSGFDRKPAAMVAHFLRERARHIGAREVRLHVFGYDVDNAKARGWIDAIRPAFVVMDPAHGRRLVETAQRLTDGTETVANALLFEVKRGLFPRIDDATGDLTAVRGELWDVTEREFFAVMRRVADVDATFDDIDDACLRFATRALRDAALSIFDRWCPTTGTAPHAIRRVVAARLGIILTLGGCSKSGKKLYDVDLGVANPCARRYATTIEDADPAVETTL